MVDTCWIRVVMKRFWFCGDWVGRDGFKYWGAWGGDGNSVCGDGVGTGKLEKCMLGTAGMEWDEKNLAQMGWDEDKLLLPCRAILCTDSCKNTAATIFRQYAPDIFVNAVSILTTVVCNNAYTLFSRRQIRHQLTSIVHAYSSKIVYYSYNLNRLYHCSDRPYVEKPTSSPGFLNLLTSCAVWNRVQNGWISAIYCFVVKIAYMRCSAWPSWE